MAFIFHVAVALSLIAIALGIMMIVWASRNEGKGITLTKVFGYLIVIFAILSWLCAGFYAVKYWQEGYFQTPMGMQTMQIQNKSMMGDGMSNMMMDHSKEKNKSNMSNH